MINLSGYLSELDLDLTDSVHPLSVNSCGYYRLLHRQQYETYRPQGRQDYQLLYVAAGSALFTIDGTERRVREGELLCYRPGEPQFYCYFLKDQPEIYWLHFTGAQAEALITTLNFEQGVCRVGQSGAYSELFRKIISELQIKPPRFGELTALYARELLLLFARACATGEERSGSPAIREAVQRIHREFQQPVSIKQYAQDYHMSLCWFIRSFRAYTGVSPKQFLLQVRLTRAKELLASTSYQVGEIAALVGYDNPLYFSRLFKNATGLSPKEFRLRQMLTDVHSQSQAKTSQTSR